MATSPRLLWLGVPTHRPPTAAVSFLPPPSPRRQTRIEFGQLRDGPDQRWPADLLRLCSCLAPKLRRHGAFPEFRIDSPKDRLFHRRVLGIVASARLLVGQRFPALSSNYSVQPRMDTNEHEYGEPTTGLLVERVLVTKW